MVTINAKESLLVTKDLLVMYIKVNNKSLEASFQSFKIVATSYVAKKAHIPCLTLSEASQMIAKVMLEN